MYTLNSLYFLYFRKGNKPLLEQIHDRSCTLQQASATGQIPLYHIWPGLFRTYIEFLPILNSLNI